MTDFYFFLFCDSFFAAIILPPRSEMAIKAMVALNQYNSYLIFIVALIASCCGSAVNFVIGKYFTFLRKSEFFKSKEKEILFAELKWHKYLIWILLFSWLDVIGAPFAVMAGFFKTNLNKFLALMVSSKIFYYYLLIFCDLDLKTILG